MKFAEELYPKGTFKGQKTDGAYLDNFLAGNLNVLAKKITEDMHFLGLISGNDSVGNGKTTIATHVGSYLTWMINKTHNLNNEFTSKNMVFNSKDLAKVSFELPPYSVIILDEGDDLVTHGMKDLAVRLKRYFRKCRQLNQIVILILPSFFELPKFFALARSHFLINVKFYGEFERGVYDFYGPAAKKMLYIRGKRDWDYNAWKPDFDGAFDGYYCFFPELEANVKRYKSKKYYDMVTDHEESLDDMSAKEIIRQTSKDLFKKCRAKFPKIKLEEWTEPFGVSKRTLSRWNNDDKNSEESLEFEGQEPTDKQ